MTVLRHQAPAGAQVTARLYSGNKYAPGSGTALTAVADAQGWASFTLPDPGSRKAYWTLTRPGASPVVVAVPRGQTTVDSTAVQLGTLDLTSDLVDTRPPSTPLSPADLAAIHDTDPERETFVPARLSDAALRAVLAPFGTPGERTLTAAADVSGAPAPTALAFKRWFTRRHFFDLKLPLGELDLSISPLAAGGSIFTPVPVLNGGMTIGYNAAGQLTLGHTTDATQTEGSAQLWPVHPFATYELNVASWTASVYGNMGFEIRNADGSIRILISYSKSGGRVQFEQLNAGTSQGLVSQTIAQPGAFTLRVQLQGRSLNVWITVGGTTTYCGRLALVGLDFRNPVTRAGWTVGILGRGYTDFTFAVSGASAYLAGHGHADPRVVTYEDGTPIQVGETVWLTMTTRGVQIPDAYQGVYAYNTATGQLTATGAIFCDRGDGIGRNENAGHIFYDRTVGKWRYLTIGHSDFPGARLVYLSTGDTDLRYGINTTPVTQVNIVGDDGVNTFYEDVHMIYDSGAGKWVATGSKNASASARLEAADPLGPWTEKATAGSSETGNLIVKIGANRYVLAGTATAAYVVRDYNTLASLGNLSLDYDTGATRVWPVVFPVKTASGNRWHMVSFDRSDPSNDHGYGRVARYRA
jgi:hypothetical protein